MIDARFVLRKGPLSLEQLAQLSGASLVSGEPSRLFDRVSPLETADETSLSFCHNALYVSALQNTHAGAILVSPDLQEMCPPGAALLLSTQPLKAFSLILGALFEEKRPAPQIHPTAVVHHTARIGEGCFVGPGAVLEAHVVVEPGCVIEAHAVLGEHVEIGEGCWIGSHVSLSHACVGRFVKIKPGARIGQRGFGFFLGREGDAHISQPQLGRVLIGDHVEIGANTTIDRGSLKDTVIQEGARIDNLVQLAHNVHVGRGAVLVAQVGIAGSTTVGDFSVLAGQVGVAGHLTLGPNVKVAAKSGLMRSVPEGQTVGGIPAVSIGEWRRQVLFLQKSVRPSMIKKTEKNA